METSGSGKQVKSYRHIRYTKEANFELITNEVMVLANYYVQSLLFLSLLLTLFPRDDEEIKTSDDL